MMQQAPHITHQLRPCLARWRGRWSGAGWLLVRRWLGCTGSPAPRLRHSLASAACSWGIATQPKSPACVVPSPSPIPKGGWAFWAALPACWPGEHALPRPPQSCSFPGDTNPHHIHPPPTATQAQVVFPSLKSCCFTSHDLQMRNKIAASSQTHHKKRKGARKGWVRCVFQGM